MWELPNTSYNIIGPHSKNKHVLKICEEAKTQIAKIPPNHVEDNLEEIMSN
jgi:hypothetical protein